MQKYLIIFVLLFLSSCKDDFNVENSKIIDIDVNKSVKFFDAEKILDSIEHQIIMLDTANNSIIGNIAKLSVCDSNIYLLDDIGKIIWIYNSDGKYLAKISAKGQARNEYIQINDFYVQGNFVYILDNVAMKLLVYNNNGLYVKTININDYWANSIFVLKDNIFLFNHTSNTNKGKYHIFKIDFNGNMLDSYLKFDKDYGIGQDQNIYSKVGDIVNICLSPDNLIYQIDSIGCNLNYAVNFVDKNLPRKYYKNNLQSLIDIRIPDNFILEVDKFQESHNYIFINFWYKSEYYTAIYNKTTENAVICQGILVTSSYKMSFGKYFVQGDYVYNVFDTNVFKAIADEVIRNNRIDDKYILEIKKIYETISNNGNPIIIKYKLK